MSAIPAPIQALPQRAGELHDLLVQWCEQNSGSEHPAGLRAMAGLLVGAFQELGGRMETVPLPGTDARAVRLVVRPEAAVRVLLSGHYDTVYGAEHPFQACRLLDKDTLNGPGAADMKGGLVAMLAALQAFEKTPACSRLGYEVLLSPDEEIGTPGTAGLLAEAAQRCHLALVFEPARPDGRLVRTRMGTGRLTVRVRGRAAHAARPGEGINAISALARFLVAIDGLPGEIPGLLLTVVRAGGGSGALNIVPDHAEAIADVRVASAEAAASLTRRVEAIAAAVANREGLSIEPVVTLNRPAKGTGPTEAALFSAFQSAAADLGHAALDWVDVAGGSDGNLLHAAGLPNLDGIGPVGDHLHSERETVSLPSVVQSAQRAALVLHRLAAGDFALPPVP